ncbi:MAG: hypothetical protein H7Y32_20625 [Chloroflexales bacterium]|nr:hypothetical protein [Chloroflexales bacterium]
MLTIRKTLVMGWIILILFVLFRRGDVAPGSSTAQQQTNQAQVTEVYTIIRR